LVGVPCAASPSNLDKPEGDGLTNCSRDRVPIHAVAAELFKGDDQFAVVTAPMAPMFNIKAVKQPVG
jgi:hypothetical protein